MADSEVEVSAAQAVPDEQEAEAAGGAEAPKDNAAAAVEDIETPTGDRKQKLEDLEPHEEDNEAPLKKQESSTESLEPSAAANESGPGGGEADAGGLVDGSGAHSDGTLAAAPEEVNLNNSEHAETEIGVTGDVRVEADPQTPIRPSPLSGYSQQNYQPCGHSSVPHWGGRASAPAQPTMGYDYLQKGNYPPQTTQYPLTYGGYSQLVAPRGGFGGPSWDQRPSAPGHNTPSGGYDYYSQGAGTQASMPNPISGPTPAPGYYGQSQAPNYGHPSPYGQAAPTQNYCHGYNEPREGMISAVHGESQDSSIGNATYEVSEGQKSHNSQEKKPNPVINVKVLFFARARDLTGLADMCLEIPDGSTAKDCMTKLLIKFPNLREIYNSMVLALNEEFAPESTVLRNNDEIAIIPPISGG